MIYIVAHNQREAVKVARRRELPPGAWRFTYLAEQLWGTRHPQVIVACWPDRTGSFSRAIDAAELAEALRWTEAEIEHIGCPYRG